MHAMNALKKITNICSFVETLELDAWNENLYCEN